MIRAIDEGDTEFLVDCLYNLREESPTYNNYPADEDYTRAAINNMFASPIFIGLIEEDKGFMLGGVASPWFSPVLRAHEELLYVLPAYRGTLIAPRLIKSFVFEADKRGCIEILAGVSTDINDTRVRDLYHRLGFYDRGNLLVKELRSVHRT